MKNCWVMQLMLSFSTRIQRLPIGSAESNILFTARNNILNIQNTEDKSFLYSLLPISLPFLLPCHLSQPSFLHCYLLPGSGEQIIFFSSVISKISISLPIPDLYLFSGELIQLFEENTSTVKGFHTSNVCARHILNIPFSIDFQDLLAQNGILEPIRYLE